MNITRNQGNSISPVTGEGSNSSPPAPTGGSSSESKVDPALADPLIAEMRRARLARFDPTRSGELEIPRNEATGAMQVFSDYTISPVSPTPERQEMVNFQPPSQDFQDWLDRESAPFLSQFRSLSQRAGHHEGVQEISSNSSSFSNLSWAYRGGSPERQELILDKLVTLLGGGARVRTRLIPILENGSLSREDIVEIEALAVLDQGDPLASQEPDLSMPGHRLNSYLDELDEGCWHEVASDATSTDQPAENQNITGELSLATTSPLAEERTQEGRHWLHNPVAALLSFLAPSFGGTSYGTIVDQLKSLRQQVDERTIMHLLSHEDEPMDSTALGGTRVTEYLLAELIIQDGLSAATPETQAAYQAADITQRYRILSHLIGEPRLAFPISRIATEVITRSFDSLLLGNENLLSRLKKININSKLITQAVEVYLIHSHKVGTDVQAYLKHVLGVVKTNPYWNVVTLLENLSVVERNIERINDSRRAIDEAEGLIEELQLNGPLPEPLTAVLILFKDSIKTNNDFLTRMRQGNPREAHTYGIRAAAQLNRAYSRYYEYQRSVAPLEREYIYRRLQLDYQYAAEAYENADRATSPEERDAYRNAARAYENTARTTSSEEGNAYSNAARSYSNAARSYAKAARATSPERRKAYSNAAVADAKAAIAYENAARATSPEQREDYRRQGEYYFTTARTYESDV